MGPQLAGELRRWRHSQRSEFRRAFDYTRALPRTRPTQRPRKPGCGAGDYTPGAEWPAQWAYSGSWSIYRSTLFAVRDRQSSKSQVGLRPVVDGGPRTLGAVSSVFAARTCRCDILPAQLVIHCSHGFQSSAAEDADAIRSGNADAGVPSGYIER